jgi:hypothetical protein
MVNTSSCGCIACSCLSFGQGRLHSIILLTNVGTGTQCNDKITCMHDLQLSFVWSRVASLSHSLGRPARGYTVTLSTRAPGRRHLRATGGISWRRADPRDRLPRLPWYCGRHCTTCSGQKIVRWTSGRCQTAVSHIRQV